MSDCIRAKGALNDKGYGSVWRGGRSIGAHRAAWEDANGPIPAGMNICHRCDVTWCVNPEHLFLGTQSDNMRDAVAKGRRTPPDMRGERGVSAKLSVVQVRDIFARRRAGEGRNALAREFRVSGPTITHIMTGKNWRVLGLPVFMGGSRVGAGTPTGSIPGGVVPDPAIAGDPDAA